MSPYLELIASKDETQKAILGKRRRKPSTSDLSTCYVLSEKNLFIGRSSDELKNAFNPEDMVKSVFGKIISRKHAVLIDNDGIWSLKDLGSRNGTYVNGSKLTTNVDKALADGDIIRFGPKEKDGNETKLIFMFHFDKEEVSSAKRLRIELLGKQLKEELQELTRAEKREFLKKLNDDQVNDISAESLTYSGLDPESIKRELCCAICREVYLFAHVLPCGHTFCKKCIDRWMKSNLSCPLCRVSATDLPIPSKKIDDFVAILVSASESNLVPLYSSDDTCYASDSSRQSEKSAKSIVSCTHSLSLNNKALLKSKAGSIVTATSSNFGSSQSTPLHISFSQRKKEYEKECSEAKKKSQTLAGLLNKVQNVGYRFVDATKPWSNREQDRFLHGLRTYSGPARVAYCNSVSLNLDFIGRASIAELKTVCENLKVTPVSGEYAVDKEEPVNYQSWIENDTRNVRTRLKMFIHYC